MTSLDKLSDETGLTVQEVKTALKKLISSKCITKKSTNKYTIITVVNYDSYQQTNNKPITNGQQTNNKPITTTNKDKKVKKDKKENNNTYMSEIKRVFELYNEICIKLPRAIKLTAGRKKSIHARYVEHPDISFFENFFKRVSEIDFLNGSTGWKADLDWLMNDANMTKVLEGKYENKPKEGSLNGINYGNGFGV